MMGLVSQASAPKSVTALREVALYEEDLEAQGQAILALVQHGDADAIGVLLDIEGHGRAPEILRTWAAAGAVQRAASLKELGEMSELLSRHPALERPFRLAALSLMKEGVDVEALLVLSAKVPALQAAFGPPLSEADAGEMAGFMLRHEDNGVRRLAAGYLAARDDAADQIITVYRYVASGRDVPWQGGALYVPSLGWGRTQAKELMGHLTAWHLHCDRHGLESEKQQVFNNLRSVGIWRQAGSKQSPRNDTVLLLSQYAKLVGVKEVARMLSAQGVRHDPRYSGVLEGR
jgi:hypothetical protein